MKISIIDYGSGNLYSVLKAFEYSAYKKSINADISISKHPEQIKNADRIILPGVGTYYDCYNNLNKNKGMLEILKEKIIKEAKPFFGICVGMQLLSNRGFEKSISKGLGWINGDVILIKKVTNQIKVPHIGWNTIKLKKSHMLFNNIPTGKNGLHAYFVHSYWFKCHNEKNCLATTNHGNDITAVVIKNNIIGTQFHPEKSQYFGIKLISNFLEWMP